MRVSHKVTHTWSVRTPTAAKTRRLRAAGRQRACWRWPFGVIVMTPTQEHGGRGTLLKRVTLARAENKFQYESGQAGDWILRQSSAVSTN